jgi:hypothetical protein
VPRDKVPLTCEGCGVTELRCRSDSRHCRPCAALHVTLVGYGVTVAEFHALLARQGGVCAICGKPGGKKRLALDHCHRTGEIRGLLCGACNIALGLLRDSPSLIRRAAAYVDQRKIAFRSGLT